MSTTSGSVSIGLQLKESLAASTSRLFAFDVPVQPNNTYSFSDGTGAGTVTVSSNAGTITVKGNKVYQASGSAVATNVDIDLTAVTCVDGSTGFSYVRAIFIFNDATTTAYTLTTGAGTNPFVPYLTGTTPAIVIDPGGLFVAIKALGTNGFTVDSSNKTVRLASGANTVPYRIVVVGN